MNPPINATEALTGARMVAEYLTTMDRANALKNGTYDVRASAVTEIADAVAEFLARLPDEADLPEPNTSSEADIDVYADLASVLPSDYAFTVYPEERGHEVAIYNDDRDIVTKFWGGSAEAALMAAYGAAVAGGVK